MRLIDVKTLQIKEFSQNVPPYAILSHTWGSEEVIFQEYLLATGSYGNKHPHTRRKEGYSKIIGACKRAEIDGLQYLWCDTNCIDKSSSAELSEAINSMYAWYYGSVVCYAFLADVNNRPEEFAISRWFTRGWTLQELLAPQRVIFFNSCWDVLGTREDLADTISDVTRIHRGALLDRNTVSEYSIAQRLSWAADRMTSRQEDIAYCLLGIFMINMPLLYGEGGNAFFRLQEAIIKATDDQSLLAWEPLSGNSSLRLGALSLSPAAFRGCGSIVRHSDTKRIQFSIVNLGIAMRLPIVKTLMEGVVLIGLNCANRLQISGFGGDQRLMKDLRIWVPAHRTSDNIYIRGHYPCSKILLEESYHLFARPVYMDIFLAITMPNSMMPVVHHPLPFDYQQSLAMSTGCLISVASGKMLPPGRVFSEVYSLGRFSIAPLKSRGRSTPSHQIISSGNMSTFLSVFWNDNERPLGWKHTTIVDPKLEVSRKMALDRQWGCLFRSHHQLSLHECCRSMNDVEQLHAHIQKAYSKYMISYTEQETYPLIWADKDSLQNLHGLPEMSFNIIFREKPMMS